MNNDADVTITLGCSAFNKKRIGLKNIPPPIPTIPETKPKTAPINKDEAIGYVAVELGGKTVTTIKLFAMESVAEGGLYRKTMDSILKNF